MPPKKTASKRPYKKRAYKPRAKKAASKLVTKAQLYKAIAKQTETKQATTELTFTTFNSPISSATGEFYVPLPGLGQGVAADQRLGDQIRPKRLVIRGYINYDTTDTSDQAANMIISRLFCFSSKAIRDNANKGSMSSALLTNGGNPSQFTGALLDITRPQNREYFTFYKDMRHTFLKPFGYTGNNIAPSVNQDITAMDRSLVKFFTITLTQKHMPAVFKYDTNAATFPTNFLPCIALGYAYASNATPDSLLAKIGMSYSATLYYEDA